MIHCLKSLLFDKEIRLLRFKNQEKRLFFSWVLGSGTTPETALRGIKTIKTEIIQIVLSMDTHYFHLAIEDSESLLVLMKCL